MSGENVLAPLPEWYYLGSMPPQTGAVPITPSPARVAPQQMSPRRGVQKWGSVLLVLITLTFVFSAILNEWNSRLTGSVTLVVRDASGGRTIETFSLSSKDLTPLVGVDANSVTTVSARTFKLTDGSTITLGTAGVVQQVKGGSQANVLIASPVAPLLRTPLTVWGDGVRVAWMSPVDGSIQVFSKSARGAYLPNYLNTELFPNSLGFSEDGLVLVAGRIVGEQTELYAIRLVSGRVTKLATIEGLASVVPTP